MGNIYNEYVGLYTNVEKVYENENFMFYKWYDKSFIISKVPSEVYKSNNFGKLFTKLTYKPYCCAVIELTPERTSVIDFANNEETSVHIIDNYIEASNLATCSFNSEYQHKPVMDDMYEGYLKYNTFWFFMKYLKFRDGSVDTKFYNVRFFKLENDLVELLEIR